MTVQYTIHLPRPAYVTGEAIVLEQTIHNGGSQPLELPDPEQNANWQPVYTLAGPQPTIVRQRDLRTAVYGPSKSPPAPSDAVLLTLAPGQTWTGSTLVDALFEPDAAGDYAVTAELTWGGTTIQSNTAQFTLRPAASDHVAIGVPLAGRGEEFYLLHSDGPTIYRRTIANVRPDLGEASLGPAAAVGTSPAPVERLDSPTSTRLRGMDEWWLWQGGDTLFLQSIAEPTPQTLTVGGAALIHPAWITEGEVVWAALLDPAGPTLQVVRAERKLGPKSRPPAQVAASAWPGVPTLATVAVSRDGLAGGARIVTAWREGSQLRLALADVRPTPSLQLVREHRLDDLDLHPGSAPSAAMDRAGNVHLWVVALAHGDLDRPVLLHVQFPPRPSDAVGVRVTAIPVAHPIERAVTRAFVSDDAHRLSALVRQTDGALLYVRPDLTATPVPAPPAPDRIAELLVTGDNSYLLTSDDGRFAITSLDEITAQP